MKVKKSTLYRVFESMAEAVNFEITNYYVMESSFFPSREEVKDAVKFHYDNSVLSKIMKGYNTGTCFKEYENPDLLNVNLKFHATFKEDSHEDAINIIRTLKAHGFKVPETWSKTGFVPFNTSDGWTRYVKECRNTITVATSSPEALVKDWPLEVQVEVMFEEPHLPSENCKVVPGHPTVVCNTEVKSNSPWNAA